MRIAARGIIAVMMINVASIGAQDAVQSPVLTADVKVNARLDTIVKEHKAPGLVAAIVCGNEMVAVGAAGVRKSNSPQPMTINDKLHLGSCTKAMTATRIAMLVEAGKLDWNSTLAAVFPDERADIHEDYQPVTLTELLTHRAGLPANVDWRKYESQLPVMQQRLHLLRDVLKQKPRSKPGTKFEYSNVGYALAGAMAEKITGQSWEELMRDGLFKPLAMNSAGFGPPGTKGEIDEPWGHADNWLFLSPLQIDNAPALGPAGTVHCSIADWGKFASLHLMGARQQPRLLTQETFTRMYSPPEGSDYSMGWIVIPHLEWASGLALAHDGSNTLWYSSISIAPQKNVAYLAVTNVGGNRGQKTCHAAMQSLREYFATELDMPVKKSSESSGQ